MNDMSSVDKLIHVMRLHSRSEVMLRKALTPLRLDASTLERLIKAALDALTRETPGLYMEFYSAEEIEALVTMHSSPLGQKGLNQEPLISARIEAIVTAALENI